MMKSSFEVQSMKYVTEGIQIKTANVKSHKQQGNYAV
jgi:hypothetical protein